VVIALTKEELKEIYGNGCLETTKALWKCKHWKARAVAGANNEWLVSTWNLNSISKLTENTTTESEKD
jgi:hypothetical protein